MSRKLAIGTAPNNASTEQRLEWLERAVRIIAQASHDIDVFDVADGFTVTNLTEDRVIDVDTALLAEVADVLGTLITDMKNRGAKRT